GREKWVVRPNPHPYAAIWGSATMVGHDVAIGVSSTEEFWASLLPPDYHPSFRGSVVLLDPADGHSGTRRSRGSSRGCPWGRGPSSPWAWRTAGPARRRRGTPRRRRGATRVFPEAGRGR